MELPEHLSEAARMVIGLFDYGIDSADEMANVLKIDDPEAREMFTAFVGEVLASDNDIVVDMLVWGLPVQFSQSLPEHVSVRCRACGSNLNALPCVTCGRRLLLERSEDGRAWNSSGTPLREPAKRTDAPAGSAEKIEVMRKRVASGEGPTHPDDPWLTFTGPDSDFVSDCHKCAEDKLDDFPEDEAAQEYSELLEAA